jgi:hypothetical protein
MRLNEKTANIGAWRVAQYPRAKKIICSLFNPADIY